MARFLQPIRKLRGVRNPAAHAEKIDREAALLVYSAWFCKGLLKELLAAILPTK